MLTLMLFGLSFAVMNHEEQVKEADASWRDAVIKIDIPALEQVLADDLTYTHSSGRTETKAEFIQATKSASLKYEAMEVSDVRVRVKGNTAILTMVADMRVRPTGGQSNSFRARVLRVYVREKDRWRLAAHQSTRMSS